MQNEKIYSDVIINFNQMDAFVLHIYQIIFSIQIHMAF